MVARILLLFIILSWIPGALSETWYTREGVNGEWTGKWTFHRTGEHFPCEQNFNQTSWLRATCTIIREGRWVAVEKRHVRGGGENPCNYFGRQRQPDFRNLFLQELWSLSPGSESGRLAG